MERKLNINMLKNIIIASLLSEGETDPFSNNKELKVPYDRKRTSYLSSLIKDNNLEDHISIQSNRGEFTIHANPELELLMRQWYVNQDKIFSFVLDPKLISIEAIIISSILFGERKADYITIPSSVNRGHLKALCFCINNHVQVPIIPKADNINIVNVPEFFSNVVGTISTLHSTHLINFLTEREKKTIKVGALL